MNELKQSIFNDIKTAMKARDKPRLGVLRLISAAIKQREVDERIELNDQQVLTLLDKMMKQRRESISQFDKADRDDLSQIEKAEMAVIQEYMPEALSADEIDILIKSAISELDATGIQDMGKVMGLLKPKLQGRVDMSSVSTIVRQTLTGS